jgi:H+/Cl- antiporter ClcA/CBS domain-containing protein
MTRTRQENAVRDVEQASTTEGLPVAPSFGPTLAANMVPAQPALVDGRVVVICGMAVGLGLVAAMVAQGLTRVIGLVTNLAFYGRFSTAFVSPAENHLGVWVIAVPVVGGLIVGLMARYGSKAIRGHGIPEAMEQVLTNESRIPARLTFLKPISAAIAIGTGGPFGAEGPIIATGGALGSLLGQVVRTTALERKTLLAAGAAAGMAATFGSPVSAVLLAIELLLFEYRPRSLIPVALAAAAATGLRIAFAGSAPVFAMPDLVTPSGAALACYIGLGGVMGVAAVLVTRAVYAIEDGFERLPLPWMWWPAIGAVAVGVVGYVAPHTMGVGYDNIEHIISGSVVGPALWMLCGLKFLSWSISLGSGTSGGTLAPLFTIGGGLGAALGALLVFLLPAAGVDVRLAALVGMAAIFAGASRALLASAVFAFETTRQPIGLLPLLGGCTASFLVSCLLMKNSIMTEKIERRGVRVLAEYSTDYLAHLLIKDWALRSVVTLRASEPVAAVRAWIESRVAGTSHQGFPVLDDKGTMIGVLTRRDLFDGEPAGRTLGELINRPPAYIYEDCTLRDAADHMARHGVGRLPVVTRTRPYAIVGIVTRSDLVSAHARRLHEQVIEA